LGYKFKTVITAPIHEEGLKLLEDKVELLVLDRPPKREEELMEVVKDADALIVTLSVEPVTKKVIDSAPKLRIIARHGVGYDNVDVKAATDRKIWVTIAPVNSETVADLTFTLMLTLARKVCQANQFVKSGKWKVKDPFLFRGFDIHEKTLGIIGLGRIGQAVARRAKGFGMRVIYYDIYRNEKAEKELGAEFKPLEELLKESDFVSIHVPLTKETYHLIGERELKMMKPTAILVNTARGPIIDTEALVKALKEGWIAGAGLDVFEQEPLPSNHPLLKLENVVLTPHIGANTVDCRIKMAKTVAEEVLRVLSGERPKYPVNNITSC